MDGEYCRWGPRPPVTKQQAALASHEFCLFHVYSIVCIRMIENYKEGSGEAEESRTVAVGRFLRRYFTRLPKSTFYYILVCMSLGTF